MKKKRFNIFIAILSLWSYSAYSQINCTVPLAPVLTFLSVQPETGNTELTWTLSPSTDVAAYILYSYKNGDGIPIDTLWDPSVTNFTVISTAARYFSVSYVMASYRLPIIPGMAGCPSPLSNALNTIFCSSEIDTCNKKILLKWNGYPDYPKHVLQYKIFVSVNGSPVSEMYSVDNLANTFTISDFISDSQYCFVIKAVLEGGYMSSSNISCLSTKMQRAPRWINSDYATVNADNKISLSYTIDPLSEITRFRLERKSGPTANFKEIAQLVSVNGSVSYTDGLANVDTVNYYRLTALNNCNIPVTVSNLSSNMVLSSERKANDLNISWNSYKEWLGMVSSYTLFINTGNGFEEKAVLQAADTSFTIGYQELMSNVTGNEVCFYVRASETSNPYGVTGQSTSAAICLAPAEIITVPNVFTPNNDLVNDFFRPVLSFTPLDYHLIISDRQGRILFETRDYSAAWDGSQNGNPVPQDVCLWFLKVKTPSGKTISKTGTITIIKSR